MIREYRAGHPRATYREALASVLDYRSWHAFELLLIQPGEPEARLTRAKHSVMSGGEKSAAIHLPLFAAANALYSSAKDHCPRMIALDEAFVGIDERYKPDLFGLAVKFDLDLFMTGHDLWVTAATVPMIAHYDMYHDKTTRTVSSLLMLWDGEQLVDASAGYADNDALVAAAARLPADPARAARHRLDAVRGTGGSRGLGTSPTTKKTMPNPYDGPEYRRLLERARRSLERTGGDLSGSVSLADPGDAERKAIIGLTGQYRDTRTNRIAVRLADLDHAVREATGHGLRQLLAEQGGPLRDRPAERSALAGVRDAALSGAEASSLHASCGWYRDWLAEIARDGSLTKLIKAGEQARFGQAVRVLEYLGPADRAARSCCPRWPRTSPGTPRRSTTERRCPRWCCGPWPSRPGSAGPRRPGSAGISGRRTVSWLTTWPAGCSC